MGGPLDGGSVERHRGDAGAAVGIDLLNLDLDHPHGGGPGVGKFFQLVVHGGQAVDAHADRLLEIHEQQAGLGVGEDVADGVEEVVAGVVRKQQGAIVGRDQQRFGVLQTLRVRQKKTIPRC